MENRNLATVPSSAVDYLTASVWANQIFLQHFKLLLSLLLYYCITVIFPRSIKKYAYILQAHLQKARKESF